MNTITFELCAEDRARLDAFNAKQDAILAALECCTGTLSTIIGREPQNPPQETVSAVVEETAAPEPETPTAAESVSLEALRAKSRTLIEAGKKAEVRSIIQQYAANVPSLRPEQYAAVWQQLIELEGRA